MLEAQTLSKKAGVSFWALGEVLYSKVVLSANEKTIRGFYKPFPPFSAILTALWNAGYHRCVGDHKLGSPSMNAGRLDLMMAAYLPFCDLFVSHDGPQLRCLKEVAEQCNLRVSVCSYTDFRAGLMVSAIGQDAVK